MKYNGIRSDGWVFVLLFVVIVIISVLPQIADQKLERAAITEMITEKGYDSPKTIEEAFAWYAQINSRYDIIRNYDTNDPLLYYDDMVTVQREFGWKLALIAENYCGQGNTLRAVLVQNRQIIDDYVFILTRIDNGYQVYSEQIVELPNVTVKAYFSINPQGCDDGEIHSLVLTSK